MGLKGQRRRRGYKKVKAHDEPLLPTRKDLGISKRQAEDWQALAKVPDKVFEAALADPIVKFTTAGVIARGNKPMKKVRTDPRALWVWGRLRGFERHVLNESPKDIASKFDAMMSEDVVRLCPRVIAWLHAFLKEIQID